MGDCLSLASCVAVRPDQAVEATAADGSAARACALSGLISDAPKLPAFSSAIASAGVVCDGGGVCWRRGACVASVHGSLLTALART